MRTPERADVLLPCRTCSGTGRSIDLDQWELSDHARRLIEICWHLGSIPELEPLRLRKWAHMLGFGGHFATKSRAYSTTFGALRQERADFTARQDPYMFALGESPDVLVINHWSYAGRAAHLRDTARGARRASARRYADPSALEDRGNDGDLHARTNSQDG
ncbi:hypothetical protein KGA66_06305 [Actinocrinis puniceicyclus]|uniref:Uncharacterized protein n=1 Tax=Actinocrinis puniceicyclus TaxID=977794 RepID=A0A8J8BDB7_9ACTN|nr:replication initiator [Actinocrinis puniceicyclus]MBS2962649.1 hypothetical protein [Actinocrinis puniceicyclus]